MQHLEKIKTDIEFSTLSLNKLEEKILQLTYKNIYLILLYFLYNFIIKIFIILLFNFKILFQNLIIKNLKEVIIVELRRIICNKKHIDFRARIKR